MLGFVVLATFLVPVGAPARTCPAPAPCVCVCQNQAAPATVPPPARSSVPDGGPSSPLTQHRAGFAPRASFAPPPTASVAPSREESRWYGGPAVAIDSISVALMAGGIGSENGAVFLAGATGFAFGGPAVHLANGRPSRALASLGVRTLGAGVATGALLLDVLSHPCDGEPSCRHYPSLGLALGTLALLGTSIIDDGLLARAAPPATSTGATISAGVVLGPHLALVSVGGIL